METYQKRIITPVWNSSITSSSTTQINIFPTRTNNHSRRFYGRPATKKPNSTKPTFYLSSNNENSDDNGTESFTSLQSLNQSNYITAHSKNCIPIRSQTTMAFCSTSKVKHAPLAGQSVDSFAGLRLGTTHPTIYSQSPRPASRPVVLHGKRFTVIPHSNVTSNGLSGSEDAMSNHKSEYSEQRRRFIEAEKNQYYSKFYRKTNIESYDNIFPPNYCISGRKLNLKGISKETDIREALKEKQKKKRSFHSYHDEQQQNDQNCQTEGTYEETCSYEKNETEHTELTKKEESKSSSSISINIKNKNNDMNDTKTKMDINNNNSDGNNSSELVNRIVQIISNFQPSPEILEANMTKISEFLNEFVLKYEIESLNEKSVEEIWKELVPTTQKEKETNIDELVMNINSLFDSNNDTESISEILNHIDELSLSETSINLIKKLIHLLSATVITKLDIDNIIEFFKVYSDRCSYEEIILHVIFCIELINQLVSLSEIDISTTNHDGQIKILLISTIQSFSGNNLDQTSIQDDLIQEFEKFNNLHNSKLLSIALFSTKKQLQLYNQFISIDYYAILNALLTSDKL